MPSALTLPRQARIIGLRFVAGNTIEIGQPCFNSPSRYEREYAVTLRSYGTWVYPALGIELGSTRLNPMVIAVYHYYQGLRYVSTPVLDEFLGEA